MMREICLGILIFYSAICAYAEVSQVNLDFEFAISADLEKALSKYFENFVGQPSSPEIIKKAENFLGETYFIADSQCSIKHEDSNKVLSCFIFPKRIIDFVGIENLPAALLESELKRKLPVQLGQMVDFRPNKINETLELVENRTQSFLKKHGYYGSSVYVKKQINNEKGTGQVTISIVGGTFVRVTKVDVETLGEAPIRKLAIQKAYRRMGVSLNQIAFWLGVGASYYSRELERQTTERLLQQMADKGYVQARIRVTHKWVDPWGPEVSKRCRAPTDSQLTPQCVNLRVEVTPGPKVTWEFNLQDNKITHRNGLQRFIASLMASEQLYRIFVTRIDAEQAFDHKIIDSKLENQVTFASVGTVDDAELIETTQKIQKYLVGRGYTNAQVFYKIDRKNSEFINIHFEIFTHEAYHVNSVKIFPVRLAEFVRSEQLNNLIPIRSAAHSGVVSLTKIKNTVPQLTSLLEQKGFQDVIGEVALEKNADSSVDIIFYMKSSGRKIINSLEILNGDPELNNNIMPKLLNCDSYHEHQDEFLSRCYSSSFVANQVEQDAQVISNYYRNQGFLYAQVQHSFYQTPKGAKIIFNLYDERYGPDKPEKLSKQIFKGFIFSGFKNTRNSVIRRLFYRSKLGAELDPQSLKKGVSMLRESGRFLRIDHKLVFAHKDSEDVYFMLQSVERPSLAIDFGARFSTDHLFSFEAELEEQNLFASMLRLNTSLSLGLFIGRRSTLNNRFQWPYIFGRPLKFTINAPVIIYENRPFDDEPFRRLKSKISTNLEWRATKNLIPYIRYWVSSTQEQRGKVFVPIETAGEKITSLDGLISTIKLSSEDFRGVLKPGFSYMRLDNHYDPRLGAHTNNWVELSGGPFFGDPSFINIGTQNRFFIPIGATTLALQATFMRAFISPSAKNWLALKNGSSMDKLGGDRNVRGYDYESIGIIESRQTQSRFAGYFSNIANIELRFPLTQEQELGNFSGAIFVDQGTLLPCESLTSCFENKSINSMIAQDGFALSIGAAIRYALPVGPVSLDYAISPIHAGRWRVHLLFGYAF